MPTFNRRPRREALEVPTIMRWAILYPSLYPSISYVFLRDHFDRRVQSGEIYWR